MQLPPPTEAFQEAESLLFLLAALDDLSGEQIEIDGGPRLDVFETGIALSRAGDLAKLSRMS